MKNINCQIILMVLLIFFPRRVMAQAKLVVNGGVITIANGASLIIDNPDNTAITYNGTGYIQSEGDANKLIWSIGAGNGKTFLIPFGNAAYNFPFQFNATSGTGANGQIILSTYHTPTWKNSDYLPPGVTNVNKNGSDNSAKIIDRFWQINAQGYTTKPILSNIIFSYSDIEYTAPNTIIEAGLVPQRWNSTLFTWDDYFPSSSVNTTTNKVTLSTLPGNQWYNWWTLVDASTALPGDVSSTSKGFLMPRMTSAQRIAITNAAEGLLVYDTETLNVWVYKDAGWSEIKTDGSSNSNLWTANGSDIYNINSGNVGIGLTTPLAPLHIKNNAEALRIQGTRPYFSFYDNASNLKSFILNSDNDLYIGMPASNPTGIMQLALSNGPIMTMLPSGNVGIGTTTPTSKLDVQTLNNSFGITHSGEGGNILATRMGGTSAGIGTFSNTNMRIFANGNSAMFINSGNSYVGLGVDFPANKLQVGSIGNTGYSGNDFAIGDGTNALRMYQTSAVSLIASSADILFWPKEKAGHVGINCIFPPGNKLQVGDMGPAGYNGNDIAFGNGSQATAIAQTNTSSQFASTSDFAFLPKYGTGGRVGINTGTPRAPLDVSYAININSVNSNFGYGYLTFNNANNVTGFSADDNPVQNVSIIASGRIYAKEFDAYSDARIKTITSITNSQQDLQTINALAITNYTMKDKVMYGNKTFKKVIAQEVEKVYPQVVSKHTDFIPNVYQLASTITPVADGFLLTFKTKHSINSSAKKLQVLEENKGMQQYDIVAIPSPTEVIVSAKYIKSNKVFVYGEEVDDFRTVDYEGLTTLNISATQELSKLVKKQAAVIENLERRLSALESKPLPRLVGIK